MSKIKLLFGICILSILTYLLMLQFSDKGSYLYFILREWGVFTILKNGILLSIITLVLLNSSDIIIALLVGLLIGTTARNNAVVYSATVMLCAYFIKALFVIVGRLFYTSFPLYLSEIIVISLSLLFGSFGGYIGSKFRHFLITKMKPL